MEADGCGARRPSIRSGSSCWLAARGDQILEALEDRICDVLGCCEEATEFFHVVRYRAGTQEQYKPHLDAYDTSTSRGKRATARGGQRLATALLYLNTVDVENGGCTVFTELGGLRCASRRGRLLVFHNCLAGSKDADPRLRHAGEPVVTGSDDKWVCNKWIREFPIRARRKSMMSHLYGQPAAAASATVSSSQRDPRMTDAAIHTPDDSSFAQFTRPETDTTAAASSHTYSKLLAASRVWKRQRVERVLHSATHSTTMVQPTDRS